MYAIPCIISNQEGQSIFSEKSFPQSDRNGMLLSEQIQAKTFRIRESQPGYTTDWHVAGDATMIAVLQGGIKIILQNGQEKMFTVGDVFIAADQLNDNTSFDPTLHGHKATVVGDEIFKAIHIKLG